MIANTTPGYRKQTQLIPVVKAGFWNDGQCIFHRVGEDWKVFFNFDICNRCDRTECDIIRTTAAAFCGKFIRRSMNIRAGIINRYACKKTIGVPEQSAMSMWNDGIAGWANIPKQITRLTIVPIDTTTLFRCSTLNAKLVSILDSITTSFPGQEASPLVQLCGQ